MSGKKKLASAQECSFRAAASPASGGFMYAVIRTGGKQYRVSPGDVLKIEKTGESEDKVEFNDVLAVSGEAGQIENPASAKVLGSVVRQGRGHKILVFHFKRKKQYKKLQGHRQAYTQVRIDAIQVGGETYQAEKRAEA
jgi:large subunit ribosomal protein L21